MHLSVCPLFVLGDFQIQSNKVVCKCVLPQDNDCLNSIGKLFTVICQALTQSTFCIPKRIFCRPFVIYHLSLSRNITGLVPKSKCHTSGKH